MNTINNFLEKVLSSNKRVLLFLFCLTLIVYGNILFGDFVFDDNIFIENNLQIRSPGNIEDIYTSSTTAGSGLAGDNFYRPNQQLIYTILYSLFGLSPFFFHLVSLLLHALNGFLIFILFGKLGISRRSALLGSMVFLLHPVLTQAVSYISGLSEPLVASSVLLTLLVFLKAVEQVDKTKFLNWLGVGVLIFAFGFFSKESQGVALALVILLAIFQWKRGAMPEKKKAVIFIVFMGMVCLVYVFLRLKFLNFTGVIGLSGDVNPYTTNIGVRLTTFIHVFPEYFKMIFFPWHLYYEKPYDAYASLSGAQSLTGIFIILGGAFTALVSLARKQGKIFFGLGWFFAAFVPFSGIVPLNAMYLEHWLYMPIIGIIFCLALFFDKWKVGENRKLLGALLIILALFSVRIFARNLEWGNPVKFYQNELKYTESSARIYNNLGMELADKADCTEAIVNYKKAIALRDDYPQTHHNLARCLEVTGSLEEAANEYLQALYILPNFSYSLNALYTLFSYAKDARSENFRVLIERSGSGQVLTAGDIDSALK